MSISERTLHAPYFQTIADRMLLVFVGAVVGALWGAGAAPVQNAALDQYLGGLYDRLNAPQDETMQGDQPVPGDNDDISRILAMANVTYHKNNASVIEDDYFRIQKNRQRDLEQEIRDKANWIQVIKEHLLRTIGRSNATTNDPESSDSSNSFNNSTMMFSNGSTVIEDDQIAQSIRSYYPSCEPPANMDPETWKDPNLISLYFNFDNNFHHKDRNIATALLRLYRIPPTNSTKTTKTNDCADPPNNSTEDDRLYRVSIYWYTRSKKRGLKRRLSDSKVINESARWVELSVKPATFTWANGRNLGLAVVVEDQEGATLRADRLFNGPNCMVGASTPKPIPTIVTDAVRQSGELARIQGLLRGYSAQPLSADGPLLPSIDICTLDFPENYSEAAKKASLRTTNACNLRRRYEQSQVLVQRDQLDRLASLEGLLAPTARPRRHQRQHKTSVEFDPRSRIINKHVLTEAERQQLNITRSDR